MKTWAETCASQQWKFARYIMSLPCEHWVRRMLHWQPIGRGPVGRPAKNWTSKFDQFSLIKRWDDWKNVATDAGLWMASTSAPPSWHLRALAEKARRQMTLKRKKRNTLPGLPNPSIG